MDFRQRLTHGAPVLMDGAVGTELERRGVSTHLPLWSARALLDAPEVVLGIHDEYAQAGAEVLTANTFRSNPRTLARAGLAGRDAALTQRAVSLAREAAGRAGHRCWVAGSVAPVEDCYHPERVPSDVELDSEHARHVANLKAAGVDFLLIETMGTAREARAALGAARDADLPAGVCLLLRDAEHLLGGHALEAAVEELEPFAPMFLGLNCNSPELTSAALATMATFWSGPMAAYGNLGRADSLTGWKRSEEPDDFRRYRAAARAWVRSGARLVGGCCGTTPAMIAALKRDLASGPGRAAQQEGAAS